MEEIEAIIPRKVEGKEFYADSAAEALENCRVEGYEELFMPQLIDTRIEALEHARIWEKWWCSPSIKVTGRTLKGESKVVYAHIQNYLTTTCNIEDAVKNGLVNGAAKIPQKEFQRLCDLDGSEDELENRLVWVIDHTELMNWPSGFYGIDNPTKEHKRKFEGKIGNKEMIAINHPSIPPFLGGEIRAKKYLEKHKKIRGEQISIWNSKDLLNVPLGRLLFIGGEQDDDGLCGEYVLSIGGRFVGIHQRHTNRKKYPSKKQLINLISDYVAPANRDHLIRRISIFYE